MINPTQEQLYYQAAAKAAEANELFLEMVKDGITRKELEQNIKRRPGLWERFSGYLDKLP